VTSTGCGSGLQMYSVRRIAGIALGEGDRPLTGSKRSHSGLTVACKAGTLRLGFHKHEDHATVRGSRASTVALLSSPGRRCAPHEAGRNSAHASASCTIISGSQVRTACMIVVWSRPRVAPMSG